MSAAPATPAAGPAPAPAPRRRRAPPLFAQIFALLVLSLIAALAINLAILYLLPPPPPEFFRVSEVAQALRAEGRPVSTLSGRTLQGRRVAAPPAPSASRERFNPFTGVLRDDLQARLGVRAGEARLVLLEPEHHPARRPLRNLQRQLSVDRAVPGEIHYIISPFDAAVRAPGGGWWAVDVREPGVLSSWEQRVLLWFGLSALLLAPVAYLFARRLAAPIAAFAAAAERLGRDPGAPPVVVTGSAEIETASAAFNDMQDRLRRYVADRTTMIGAVAHDLRTPLTRLRFRIESAPEPLRAKMAADMDEMEQMIAATMAFVRDTARPAERRRLELSSLVEAVADEMAETGLDVRAEPGRPVVIDGDPLALRRLVANLIDNAVKFGARARTRVYADGEGALAIVEIDDDGPGVPEHQRQQVFEPFHRGEPSRSRETGGAGLGLAVVRSIARAHGGDADLGNRVEGGLRACVRLPLSP